MLGLATSFLESSAAFWKAADMMNEVGWLRGFGLKENGGVLEKRELLEGSCVSKDRKAGEGSVAGLRGWMAGCADSCARGRLLLSFSTVEA